MVSQIYFRDKFFVAMFYVPSCSTFPKLLYPKSTNAQFIRKDGWYPSFSSVFVIKSNVVFFLVSSLWFFGAWVHWSGTLCIGPTFFVPNTGPVLHVDDLCALALDVVVFHWVFLNLDNLGFLMIYILVDGFCKLV